MTLSTTSRSGASGRSPASAADRAGSGWLKHLDSPLSTYYLLIGAVGTLLGIGLVMVLSASAVNAVKANESPYKVFVLQAAYAAVGVVLALIAARIPVATWKRLAVPMLAGALLLQLLVLTPLGHGVNGNRNWLRLGSIQLQPSELVKLGLVLFAAAILSKKRALLTDWRHAVVPLLMPVGLLAVGLVLAGNDLGTSMILLLILVGVLWAAGVSAKLFMAIGAVTAALVVLFVAVSGNRRGRLNAFADCVDSDACFQATQGRFALADGGLIGRGLGASKQKWSWVPEADNDAIFTIIGEELGLAGALVMLMLYVGLALACYRIVLASSDMFVRIATAGVMVWTLGQAFVNIGSAVGLTPMVGVPLPLVSRGGTALVTCLLAFGIVASFARSEPRCAAALAARPKLLPRTLSVLGPTRSRRSARPQRRRGPR